jgi:predicted acetyltransferase
MTLACTIRPVDSTVPRDFEMLINDIGNGENGFEASVLTCSDISTSEKLKACQEMADPMLLKPGRVPQTVYWILDEHDRAVGIIKIRHYLNEQLLIKSGLIGFYVRRDARGKGYGKKLLCSHSKN